MSIEHKMELVDKFRAGATLDEIIDIVWVDAIDNCIKTVGGNTKTIVGVVFDNSIPMNDRAYARSIKNEFIIELVKQLDELKKI